MTLTRYDESMLEACAEFWWRIYEDMPYVHRPDGYQNVNTPPIGPQYFINHFEAGLSCRATDHWHGEVTGDSIVVAEENAQIQGFLISAIDRERLTGNVLSAYVGRDPHGREVADALVTEALGRFRAMGLHRAAAAPDETKSLEVESPVHLALLDAGFAWENDWWPAAPVEQYGVFLGGSLRGFVLKPEIDKRRDRLRQDGIAIERLTADEFNELRRFDTGDHPEQFGQEVSFGALVDGLLVGWLTELGTWQDWAEGPDARTLGTVCLCVIPQYRRRGIGRIIYHLGVDEVIRRGAQYGWTATGIYNPARLIYRSIGYRYWYTCFSRMTKRL